MIRRIALLFLLLTCLSGNSQNAVLSVMDDTAAALLKDAGANSVSIIIVKGGKAYTRHYGKLDKGKGNTATDKTVFEIGSVTKVFTGLLIAKAVVEEKLNLDDDVRKYLKGPYPNLEYNGTPISVKDLLTFKTGVSRDFPDITPLLQKIDDSTAVKVKQLEDNYSKKQFFKDLAQVKLDTLPGAVYVHTKLGPELLAVILEKIYKRPFEMLLEDFLSGEVGMAATKMYLEEQKMAATGYNEKNQIMPIISDKLWGAAGLLKSTPSDLVKFINYQLNLQQKVVTESHRKIADGNDGSFGYAWNIIENSEGIISYWMHGGTFGTQNILVVCPQYNMGMSIIINQSGPDTFGHLYEARQKLEDDLKPFGKKSLARAIKKKCLENISEGIAYYHELKQNKREQFYSNESEFNNLGYHFLWKGETESALQIFTINVAEFPESANVYDSRGEAYYNLKDFALAKKDYERSLLLNPMNDNAKAMLLKLRE